METKKDFLKLKITAVTVLSQFIRLYRLSAADSSALPLVVGGAHLSLPVIVNNGKSEQRNYSICSNPLQRDYYEIAVLLSPAGNGGSVYIHANFVEGTELSCPIPSNSFQLHADARPAILIAGGIGITAIKSIAHSISARGRRFHLHYAGKSLTTMAFADDLLTEFPHQVSLYAADQSQKLNLHTVLTNASHNSVFYVCGPTGLRDEFSSLTKELHIDPDRIQQESFSSATQATDQPVILELAQSGKLIQVAAEQPLLAALRKSGIDIAFDCCVGDCGSCATQVIAGEIDHRDHVLSDEQKKSGLMCVCVSRAKSETLVLAL